MKNKKEKLVVILLVVGLIVMTVAISYAAFKFTQIGSVLNQITTGSITMSYTESSNVISMTGALPTTDTTGKVRLNEGEYFDFTVGSSITGTANINFEIAAQELDGNTIDGKYIKYYLTEVDSTGNETEVMAPKTYTEETESNEYTGRPSNMMSLYEGSMSASTTTKYRLRIYVDESYNPQGDGGNLVYKTRVNVYGLTGDEITVLDSGKCGDNLNWELLSDGTLHISGTGAMYDYNKYAEASPWYKYRNEPYISEDGTMILNSDGSEYLSTDDYYEDNPNGYKIERFVIDEGVTYIGDWAFYRICVDELTIPEGVESTGIYSIRYSPTLKTVNLPDSLKVLNDLGISRNYTLETINFGDGLETIGAGGLNGNKMLKEAILPDSLTSINIQQHEGWNGEVLDSIGLLDGCESLQKVSLGNVDSIPQRTFLNCKSLENVIIPNTVSYIGEYAFGYCNSLKTVQFESGSTCTLIESNAFVGCNSLESITGGKAIETIEKNAFSSGGLDANGYALVEFEFSDTNKTFGDTLFYKSALKSATLGKGMTSVPLMCFYGSSIETLYISNNLEEIGQSAFGSCTLLENIYYDGTFEEWSNITKNNYWADNIPSTCTVHFSDGTTKPIEDCK